MSEELKPNQFGTNRNIHVGNTPMQWAAELAKWKLLAGELAEALRIHHDEHDCSTPYKCSAVLGLAKAREMMGEK